MDKGHDKGHDKGQMSDRDEPWDTTDMAHRPGGLSMEQEPVYAFRRKGLNDFCTCDKRRYDELASKPDFFEVAVFYTAPPTQPERTVSLEEYKRLQRLVTNQGIRLMEYESKQEPVACKHNRYSVDVHEQTGTCYDCGAQGRMRFVVYETAPPKREWQGLTDEEIFDVIRPFCKDDEAAEMLINISMDEYRAIEAKLKEKNT